MDPKARREIKEKEDLLGCLEFLVFQELRDRRAWKELKEVPGKWG